MAEKKARRIRAVRGGGAALSTTATEAGAPAQPEEQSTPAQLEDSFPVVGIGASAGGLAAFEAFFSAMPTATGSGMAFVLVQHLAPDHKSILSDLVKRYTTMQVYEVSDGMQIRPDCAYIIPPNRDMALRNGTLGLVEPSAPRGHRQPIDYFFRSLAEDQHDRAICIVLSGTGSDGTLGVRGIKGEGGMIMAQTPGSAQYDGMPRSAIATGLVDYIMPPAEMPAQLAAYVSHAFQKRALPESVPEPGINHGLKRICKLLRAQTGHDFSAYKENTIIRRVARRMAVHQIDQVEDYLYYLQQNAAEGEALFRELLIGVTSFFRDTEAFDFIRTRVIPRLFAGKAPAGTVRVWVCGCSTGEEAYSIAILLQEHMESLKHPIKIQVFATDIDRRAIEQARNGIYPASIAADVTPERLARFFHQNEPGGEYRIQRVIRDLLVFSEQDVIKDPPFSKLDLICCRNLLIYLNADLQKKLIPLFHYALVPEGVLVLGTSETVGDYSALFSSLDRRTKIYSRLRDLPGVVHPMLGEIMQPWMEGESRHPSHRAVRTSVEPRLRFRELTETALLDHYAQAAVLVTGHGEILHVFGRTGKYLEPAPGDAAVNVLPMARQGLRRDLTTALHYAVSRKEVARRTGLQVKTNGHFINVNLTVRPVVHDTDSGAQDAYLVVLEEVPPLDSGPEGPVPVTSAVTADVNSDARITALERDLRTKDEYLQTTIEEMETTTEELKSSNEEMQSVNEELQSTNEEMETSKEELQSVNEELSTVNTELQSKVADLSRANNDMNNLLAGTGVATLFVDHDLRIARFTPTTTELINLIHTDVGRPVGHFVSNLVGYDRLAVDVQAVLDDLVPREAEVQTTAGRWYLMRVRPYRTLENVIEGAVITFIDITERKRAEDAQRQSENGLAAELEAIIRLQTLAGRFVLEGGLPELLSQVLESAIAIAGTGMGTIQLMDARSGQLRIEAHRGFQQPFLDFWKTTGEGEGSCGAALKSAERVIVEDVAESPIFAGKPALDVMLAAGARAVQSTPLMSRAGRALGMISTYFQVPRRLADRTLRLMDLLAHQTADIIERGQNEESINRQREWLELAHECAASGAFEWNIQSGEITWSREMEALYGLKLHEFEGTFEAWSGRIHELDREGTAIATARSAETGEDFDREFRVVWPGGAVRWLHGRCKILRDAQGRPHRMIGINTDITASKQSASAAQEP